MQFLYPLGAWALIAGLAILALYMLRRQYTEMEVPSVFLWQKTLADHTASRPIQKLRKNLLMLLQLLVVLLGALSLMRPALMGQSAGETVMIFDLSASMQATGRLEGAKSEARAIIESMGDEDRISILTVGQETRQILMRSADKRAALSAVEGLFAENGTAALQSAVSLAIAMREEIDGLSIVVFSDNFEIEDRGVRIASPESGAENRAVLSLSVQENGLAVARIANYGTDCTLTVEAYGDGVLSDVRFIDLAAGEVGSLKFTLPAGVQTASVFIQEEDPLMADNSLPWAYSDQGGIHAVLSGDGSVFWEKALQLREGLILTRTSAGEADAVGDADIYIIEGGSSLIYRNGEGADALQLSEEAKEGGALAIADNQLARALCENMRLEGVYVRSFNAVTGGTPIFTIGGETAAAMDGGALLIGFDIAESNLPMKYDFPVFVQNILDTLMPDAVSGLSGGSCGGEMEISLNPRAVSAEISTPSGRTIQVGSGRFTETGEMGIYTLIQRFEDGSESRVSFVLKIPEAESDLRQVSTSALGDSGSAEQRYSREIGNIALLLLLAAVLIEWGVSRNGRSI